MDTPEVETKRAMLTYDEAVAEAEQLIYETRNFKLDFSSFDSKGTLFTVREAMERARTLLNYASVIKMAEEAAGASQHHRGASDRMNEWLAAEMDNA